VIGRREEVERVEGLLGAARRERAGALVVVGEAGIGKTSLLQAAEMAAPDFRVLRAGGVESEALLDHAGLLQLLGPLRNHLDEVPGPQRRALEAAVGWGPGTDQDDRYLVGAGTLSLLAAAAGEAPLLVLVDDLHWLDPGSAAAVLFAARRLTDDAVVILLATRHGSPAGTALDGLETVSLDGLPATDAAGLFPAGTATSVVARVVAATDGNPLALVEVARQLSPAQRRGAAELPYPLPTGARLQAVYEPTLSSLPADCRLAVVLVAACRDEAVEPVVAALESQGLDAEAVLADAEHRGVLVRQPGLVRFRHPLLRTAAWTMATPAQRRAAHAALAAALPSGDRRARCWHLSEAATGPDPALAALLEAIAHEDRARLGHAAASAVLERAAVLSDDPVQGAERLAGAVEDAALTGDVARTQGLAQRVLAGPGDPRCRGRALAALGVLEQCTGSLARADQLMTQAAELTEGRERIRILADLAMVRHRLDDVDGLVAAARAMAVGCDHADPHQQFLSQYFDGVAALMLGDVEVGRSSMAAAMQLLACDPELRDDPRYLVLALFSAGWLDLTPELVRFIEGRLAQARERGALAVLVSALAMSSYGRAWLGDHAGAFADAGEAVELASELGFVADAAPALEMLAWQHAARGSHDDAVAELERAAQLVERAGTTQVAAHLALARAFCALCRDDLAEVVTLLEARLAADGGRGAMGEALGVAPLLIEAYTATGRNSDAASLAARFSAVPDPDMRTKALIERSRALTAGDDATAFAEFEVALATHAGAVDAFEQARTELLYGARLRRSGERVAARAHLRAARDAFIAMDLTLWAQRSTAELAATGETARHPGQGALEPLTSQETRVAILVGRGLTNREAAAALFLSPKTVERHLSSVYRKRGVRSRTELARVMAATPMADPG
jgi:DNA-binding CsgD family transcriptional regulator/tetratricopeptide (TPR) repeat protein